jgi:predicted tellurium resistance membrane protein TerC
MEELFSPTSLVAFLTLAALEIVLGIDNVVFIAVLTGRLPDSQQPRARVTGLALAAFGRILLLLGITWIMRLDGDVLATVAGHRITAKDLILILGGLFLLAKSTWEIHHSLEAGSGQGQSSATAGFAAAIVQILLLDLVFSIDSVLTAVGMVKPDDYSVAWVPLAIMSAAVLLSIAVMLLFAGPLSRFIERHPTMKVLALCFLLLIGVVLIAEGLELTIPRGYIYFAMGFSLMVELLNLKFSKPTTRREQA